MCIIIDANVIEDLNGPSAHGAIVLKWLLTGKGRMVVGGAKMREELGRSAKMRNTMATLHQAGRLRNLDDVKVQVRTDGLVHICCSDDPHVVAAVLESGCRLVFTRDRNLHKDLQNRDIVNPIASIYQTNRHRHLLAECRCVTPG